MSVHSSDRIVPKFYRIRQPGSTAHPLPSLIMSNTHSPLSENERARRSRSTLSRKRWSATSGRAFGFGHPSIYIPLSFLLLAAALLPRVEAAAVPVEVAQTADGWQLLRNGEPYQIKGAGGHNQLEELVQCGGNSIRTWGVEGLGTILDQAEANGLTVAAGFWAGSLGSSSGDCGDHRS